MAKDRRDRDDVRKKLSNVYADYRIYGVKKWGLFKPSMKRGLVVNVSKQGIGLRLTEAIKPQTELELHIELPGIKEPLNIRAKMLWVKEERKIGTVTYSHIAGGRITEFSPEAWLTVLKLLGEE